MRGPVEQHVSITTTTSDGTVTRVVRTSVRIGEPRVEGNPECFDPETCCDERERALIAAMRAYLRPSHAPQSLIDRLESTLDHCCREQ